ncbi:MAG: radical SAM protein [Sandaracinaceae bacterium]
MKALIKVGYGCNDHCSFCHTLDVRHVDAEAAEVHAKIVRAKELGHRMVVLSGGEPTIRPELLEWASHVAKLGMDFGLVTNGRMLSYPVLVEKLMQRRLKYVYLSLHGGTAKIHDLMVRSDAFEQTYGAIAVLSGRGLDFTVNCVITRHNVEHLRSLVDAVLDYPDVALKFSMVEPKGGGDKLFEHLMPDIARVADRVKDAIAYGLDRVGTGPGPRFLHGAIPLCLMRGYETGFDDLKTHRFATMIEVGEPDFYPVDDLNKIQPPEVCRGCSLSGPCPGLYRGYYQAFGASALAPVSDRPRSNSFNYSLVERMPVDRNAPCELLGPLGVTPWEPGRDLFVRRDDRGSPVLERYRADTRDFSDAQIGEVKHALGQVYLDASDKAAPDDFAADLVPLARIEACATCGERARCTGVYEPVATDAFARDDAEVADVLGALSGDVVDVGVGEGRYLDRIAARIRDGAIRYRAFDPDPDAVDRLRARLAERGVDGAAELGVDTAEAWARDVEDASVDHVLLVRSWNHLSDPRAVARAVERALRPGGTVTVVDDVAFGLARTGAHAARAERSSARLEHYRNDTAADAARAFEGTTLTPLVTREVQPGTSTLWLLRYRAPA